MSPDPAARLRNRVDRLADAVAALRVVKWFSEWPTTHRDAPPAPAFVVEFERRHGPAPASAERVLAASTPAPA